MIYGLNFNGTQIPEGVKRRFAERVKLPGMKRGEYAYLKGVGQSSVERDAMLAVADNQKRKVIIEERQTLNGVWYGLYVY